VGYPGLLILPVSPKNGASRHPFSNKLLDIYKDPEDIDIFKVKIWHLLDPD
jgi:hypothetical protein